MEFDIFDKEKQIFLSTKKRRELLKGAGFVESVLVLYEGILQNSEELKNFPSPWKTGFCNIALNPDISGNSRSILKKEYCSLSKNSMIFCFIFHLVFTRLSFIRKNVSGKLVSKL